MSSLNGRVAIVTGSASGIGAATVKLLAARGARVVVADINADGAEAVANEIRASGGDAFAFTLDVSEERDVAAMVEEATATFGGIDILHSNAADLRPEISGVDARHDLQNVPLEVWDRTFHVNVRGFLLLCRYVIPELVQRGGGSIIVTSSVAGLLGEPVRSAYGASKAALGQLGRHVATAYGKRGIRCNVVCPGPMVVPLRPKSKERQEMFLRHVLLPRLGTPEDIAEVVAFLASDRASYITGQTIAVDGGLSIHSPQWQEDQSPRPSPGV